jgi:hypothetical protein
MSSIGVDDTKTKLLITYITCDNDLRPYATHFRSLLPVMYVISSLVLVSATPYAAHLRSLLPVMYVISSLACVIHTLSYSSNMQ